MAGVTFLYKLSDVERDIVRALKPLGKKAILHAYHTGHTDAVRAMGAQYVKHGKKGAMDSKWRHKLGNLHDSFASAVFVNGVLVQTSVQYLNNPISKKRDYRTKKNGRQTVKEYLRKMSFGAKNNEIILVVIAAMFYTRWLEKSLSGSGKFVVISPAREFIRQHIQQVLEPVYRKYGISNLVKPRIIEGEYIRGLSNYKE